MTFRRLTNKVIFHSLFKFTHTFFYMVNILRYSDIIKKTSLKKISVTLHVQFNLSLGFTTELSCIS